MPISKNQIRRIQTILMMMRQNRYPNSSSFEKEMKKMDPSFTISSKTFTRDIADLRDEYKAPVQYDSSRKGYFLTNPEWYNEELMVEPFEMKAALLGERVASELFPDPLRGEISKAVSSLLMKNERGMAEGVELENFQILNPPNLPKVDSQIFLTAYQAWEGRQYLKLIYRSSQNRVREKFFEPHVFAWNGGCWYLKGKLLRDDDTRYPVPKIQVLALHRIEKAEADPGKGFWPAPEILKGVKNGGLFNFDTLDEVKIEFLAPFDNIMKERFTGTPDTIIEEKEGSLTVKLKNITRESAAQLVLYTFGNARIHAPESLREFLSEIADTLKKNMTFTE